MTASHNAARLEPPLLLKLGLFVLVEILAIRLGYVFFVEHVAIFWPANGLALGVLLATHRSQWPAYLGGFVAAYLLATGLFAAQAPAVLAGFLVANIVEILPAAWLIRQLCGNPVAAPRIRDTLLLLSLGVVAGPLIGASVAMTTLSIFETGDVSLAPWVNWALGNAASTALTALPTMFLVQWRSVPGFAGASHSDTPSPWLEGGVLLLLTAVAVGLLFWYDADWGSHAQPNYILFPFAVWGALRFPLRVTALAIPLVGLVAITGVAFLDRPTLPGGPGINAGAIADLHGYLIILTAATYLFGVLRQRRADAAAALEDANARLKTSEQAASKRAEMLLSATGEGIYGLDTQGRTTFINPAAEDLLGYTAAEMLGRRQHDLIHHSDPDGTPHNETACPIHASFREGHATEAHDDVFWRKDGTALPVAYRSNPVFGEGGEIQGAVVVFRDTSRLKEARNHLQRSEAHFRAVFDHAPIGIGILDTQGRIEVLNAKVAAMGGYRPEDLRGRHFGDLTYSEDVEVSATAFRRVLAGECEYSDLENRYICNDGSIRWGRVRLTRLGEAPSDGAPRILALVEDITERKLIAEALAREKAFSDQVITESPNLVVGIDPDGRTTFANPAAERAAGYPSADLVGRDWWATAYPGIEQEQVTRLFNRFERNEEVSEYPMTLTRRDGGKRVISWNYLNRTGSDGDIHELIGYGRDITAEHEAQAQQQQQDKLRALGEMAGGMAHEINNALQPIVGMIGLLGERAGAYDPALGQQAEVLEHYCLHARKVVSDVLAFARTEGPETEVFNAADLMSDVTAFVIRMIPSRIKVRTVGFGQDGAALPDDTGVRVSRNGMIQIVQNLVSNAADALGGRGGITISLAPAATVEESGGAAQDTLDSPAKRPPFVRISVTDEGPGMDEVTKAELFNPFFSTKPVGKGTGLGLSVVYGLLSHWDGTIDVDSAPGAGTRIAVTLPTVPCGTAPDPDQTPDADRVDPVPG